MADILSLLPAPKHQRASTTAALPPPPPPPVSLGEEHAIASSGRSVNQTVHSSITSIIPTNIASQHLEKPSSADVDETTNRTKNALEKLLGGKVGSFKKNTAGANASGDSRYVKYNGNRSNAGRSKQRVVRLVREQVDPLEPARFKHKKVASGPGSPPTPVLHSPAKKLTKEDEMAWKIPPSISNWKNRQGFTISLDKRLAADGSGLRDNTVSDRFSGFSEALFIAEKKAREEVKARQELQKKLLEQTREKEEERLRALAAKARMQRVSNGGKSGSRGDCEGGDKKGFDEREAMRRERKRERDREVRMEAAGIGTKASRDRDRDVSEKIALGMLSSKSAAGNNGAQFDERLFNQSGGMSSGFGAADEDNMYTERLFGKTTADSIYRPRGALKKKQSVAEEHMDEIDRAAKRFKGFSGTDNVDASARDGAPVQFERA